MEANSQIPVGENSLPEVIQNKNGLVIGKLNVERHLYAHKHFSNQMVSTAETIKKTAEALEKIQHKGFL